MEVENVKKKYNQQSLNTKSSFIHFFFQYVIKLLLASNHIKYKILPLPFIFLLLSSHLVSN